jgi:hypothetical protein
VRKILVTIAAAATAAISVTAAPTARAVPRLPELLQSTFGSFAIRPAQIVPSGDGSFLIAGQAAWIGRNPEPAKPGSQFGHITWTSWTPTKATGLGVAWQDNCKPSCAAGTYFPTTVRITASTPAAAVYSRLILTPQDGAPAIHYTLRHLNPGPAGYIWG